MDLDIKGKNALVFGASSGIGRSIAWNLAKEGVNLIIISRTADKLNSLAIDITNKYAVTVNAIPIDIGNKIAINLILEKTKALNVDIDIIINISGGPCPNDILCLRSEDYINHFNDMVSFFMDLTVLFVKEMMRRKWGRIITLTSSGVYQPITDLAVSNMLRAAITNWSKTLSNRVAAYGVTVNTLVPGRIATERVDSIDQQRACKEGKTKEIIKMESQRAIPLNRYGEVDEIAAVAVFLSGKSAAYITGNNIRVDGGLIKSML